MSLSRRLHSFLRRRLPWMKSKPWNRRWEIWSVGLYQGPDPFSLAPSGPQPILHPRDITDRPASLVADPFLVKDGQDWWLFAEVESERGEIGLAHSRDGWSWTYKGIVLSEPFHLSYPQVFRHNDQWYMIPETNEANAVRLYRAEDFPTTWTLDQELLTGAPLADASVIQDGGRWWMWAEDQRGDYDVLRLFFADDLLGPWSEHPQSPVGSGDRKTTRPGGRVIRYGDRIVRPAQDCANRYGERVWAMEVTELTPERYGEVARSRPWLEGSGHGWNADGMHHVDPVQLKDGTWIAAVDGWTD